MSVTDVLTTLRGRLPELEWQLHKPGLSFSPKSLPAGLFRTHHEEPAHYIAEIKADINTLAAHPNPRIVRYLAEKINQKINVLVSLCSRHNRDKPSQEPTGFIVNQLTTRRQWLQSLELEIERLEEQKNALLTTLSEKDSRRDSTVALRLQSELGALEKKLTLAREAWLKATQ
ncbi:primosomal replication protein PriC [Legionella sp. CNM-4043-24]|uniref:primosomal replication protein PriC n=1 Tax=Legionella sp. CNM-4043-24 TaxID=3421646 RepID=UPI00403B308B